MVLLEFIVTVPELDTLPESVTSPVPVLVQMPFTVITVDPPVVTMLNVAPCENV